MVVEAATEVAEVTVAEVVMVVEVATAEAVTEAIVKI